MKPNQEKLLQREEMTEDEIYGKIEKLYSRANYDWPQISVAEPILVANFLLQSGDIPVTESDKTVLQFIDKDFKAEKTVTILFRVMEAYHASHKVTELLREREERGEKRMPPADRIQHLVEGTIFRGVRTLYQIELLLEGLKPNIQAMRFMSKKDFIAEHTFWMKKKSAKDPEDKERLQSLFSIVSEFLNSRRAGELATQYKHVLVTEGDKGADENRKSPFYEQLFDELTVAIATTFGVAAMENEFMVEILNLLMNRQGDRSYFTVEKIQEIQT